MQEKHNMLAKKDNNIIVIDMEDSTIQINNVRVDEVKTNLKGHQKRITGLAFSNALNILVSSGADAQCLLFQEHEILPCAFAVGKLLVFVTQALVNYVGLHCVKPSLRPLSKAMSTVAIHIYGDVSSSPLVGVLQDHIITGGRHLYL